MQKVYSLQIHDTGGYTLCVKRKISRNIIHLTQYYKNVPLKLIVYTDSHFERLKAKRFNVNNTTQNVWIPNQFLEPDGSIKENVNIDFVFYRSKRQLELAGIQFKA